ncbi:hypothetical protein [Gimesia algae]|uniref:Uncharacterized protein n=1 Tax=Gimesia algae TaxID=2527971 RepID=A0A517VKX7_9PLAN|nr:hypothetical protein [Gimesia algae]QDT93674.1 hypothetical protein Pan161_53560 [Gimesia algae]
MNQSKHKQDQHSDSKGNAHHQGHPSYWKGAHRDWRTYVAVILMLAGMVVYVMTMDLSEQPADTPQPPAAIDAGE